VGWSEVVIVPFGFRRACSELDSSEKRFATRLSQLGSVVCATEAICVPDKRAYRRSRFPAKTRCPVSRFLSPNYCID